MCVLCGRYAFYAHDAHESLGVLVRAHVLCMRLGQSQQGCSGEGERERAQHTPKEGSLQTLLLFAAYVLL
eukprot:1464192-Rhodomonas_salina.2